MKNNSTKVPENELMTLDEMEEFVRYLINRTSWNNYAINGLTFMFNTFATLVEQDSLRAVDNAHCLIRLIYEHSIHCSNSGKDFREAMYIMFRKTDYSKELENDDIPEKETVLDLSEHTTKEGECLDLAKNLLTVLQDERLPKELVDAIHDQLTALDNKNDVLSEIATSPEYIAKILCAEKEVGQ